MIHLLGVAIPLAHFCELVELLLDVLMPITGRSVSQGALQN